MPVQNSFVKGKLASLYIFPLLLLVIHYTRLVKWGVKVNNVAIQSIYHFFSDFLRGAKYHNKVWFKVIYKKSLTNIVSSWNRGETKRN